MIGPPIKVLVIPNYSLHHYQLIKPGEEKNNHNYFLFQSLVFLDVIEIDFYDHRNVDSLIYGWFQWCIGPVFVITGIIGYATTKEIFFYR